MSTFKRLCLGLLGVLLSSAVCSTQASAATKQCVGFSANTGYNVRVQWYKPDDIVIDNSRPWDNRLYIRHELKAAGPKGLCGIDADTGAEICQGTPVEPELDEKIAIAFRDKQQSCIEGNGDYFAVVTCQKCKIGTEILSDGLAAVGTLGLGSVAGIVKHGATVFELVNIAADASGFNSERGVKEALGASIKQRVRTSHQVPIHDISDLPNSQDIVYVGTPKSLRLYGNFRSPQAAEDAYLKKRGKSYSFYIDCYHKDVENIWTRTEDTITVEFWVGKDLVASSSRINLTCPGGPLKQWQNVWSVSKLEKRPTKIVVRTNGNDALFIDRAKLNEVGGHGVHTVNLLKSPGVDNRSGWCLSHEDGDNFSQVGVNSCTPSESFLVGTSSPKVHKDWMLCGTKKCINCSASECKDQDYSELDRDKDKDDLKKCPSGYEDFKYPEYHQTWPAANVFLRMCKRI